MTTTATGPAWLACARALLGTREAAGPANNPIIMGWARRLGVKVLGIAYDGDHVAWCGLFAAQCVAAAGLAPPKIAVRASAWASWGGKLDRFRLSPGAILVFSRQGGGHVGFYVGEDLTHFHVLGGNQDDRVSIVRIEKARLIASRWPTGVPVDGEPVFLTIAGVPVSRNET